MARPRIEPAPAEGPAPSGAAGDRWSERVRGEPPLVLEAVERAAEDWGAGWRADDGDRPGGRLELPVSAGLRHGRLTARVEVTHARPDEAASEVTLTAERSEYHLWTPAVVILLIAAAGALLTVLWPFFPEALLPAAPVGAILGLSAWFLIITRLQNRGAEEFLALVVAHAGATLDGDDGESME